MDLKQSNYCFTSCKLVNWVKQRFYIAIKKTILKWYFVILNTFLHFLMITNTWQFHLLNWQGVGPVWVICFSSVYTGLLVWAFRHWHKVNHIYDLKSFLFILFSACLYGRSDSNVLLIHLTIIGLFQEIHNINSVTPPPPPSSPLTYMTVGIFVKRI